MTALHPGASRSPDRTGVCCTRWSTPSLCEMVTGPGFSSPNQPGQVRTTAYRVSSGPNSRSDAHCDTILGDWDEPSGESRVLRFYAIFSYHAGSWDRKRRVVAKMEWHPEGLAPRVGFIVTNLSRSAERVTWFYNQRGKAEQYIKEGKNEL